MILVLLEIHCSCGRIRTLGQKRTKQNDPRLAGKSFHYSSSSELKLWTKQTLNIPKLNTPLLSSSLWLYDVIYRESCSNFSTQSHNLKLASLLAKLWCKACTVGVKLGGSAHLIRIKFQGLSEIQCQTKETGVNCFFSTSTRDYTWWLIDINTTPASLDSNYPSFIMCVSSQAWVKSALKHL